MTPAAPLLFLEFEGVLVLGGSAKMAFVTQAVNDIARGKSTWREHQETWDGLFAAEAVRQLKALHDQFQLQYWPLCRAPHNGHYVKGSVMYSCRRD